MRPSQQIRLLSTATETIRCIRDEHRADPAISSACLSILEDHGRLYQLVLAQTESVDPGCAARREERVDEIRGAV